MQITSSINHVAQTPPERPVHLREHPPDGEAENARPDHGQTTSASATTAAAATAAPKFGAGGTHARLSYDFEDADVYIEILNPRTGDVIRRLPPEDAAPLISDITNAAPGAVIDGKV